MGSCVFGCFVLFSLLATCACSSHPMLYFSSEEVVKLRHKASTTHVKIAKVIEEAGRSLKEDSKYYLPPKSFEKFGSRWNELYGNNLCAFAMYCLLYPEDEKAFELVTLYMDRMTSYPDWYVTASRNSDQVPIGHSLTGYVTAFDFLYSRFDKTRIKDYLKRIKQETEMMVEIIKKKRSGWVKQHIHNHAPTNIVAILLAALVYEVHYPPKALIWKEASVELLEKAMKLFTYVIDGSCDEGVAYGSYTSRGITQYIYLAKKHLDKDHTQHPWLREHFWFFFATTMPGYQRSVGIADSNHNWFYGPESQLVFLDTYVMRNGYGNWLADRIRSAKPKNPPLARSMSQKWSTIHTEFIFYDASIPAVRPVLPSNNSLHIFNDWGVVTYGGGQYLKSGNTFFSFKSSAIHGEFVADVINYNLLSHLVNGWSNFNPGHEHPDQNSFVFAPNGRYFITEALYAPKHTHLNNVLTFSPSPSSQCTPPWEGQVGECSKWLYYKYIPVPRGKIVTVTNTDHVVHVAGEAVNAYRAELGLESVQRSLFLMNAETLVVIDSVYLNKESELTRSSAYFHNVLHTFHPYRHLGYQGAQVIYPEGTYAFFWLQDDGKSPNAQLHNHDAEHKEWATSFVNVTFRLRKDQVTRMAYVFVGPSTRIQSVLFDTSSNDDVGILNIMINHVQYKITLASTSLPAAARMQILGFGGYASLTVDEVTKYLGLGEGPSPVDRCDVIDDESKLRFVRSLISSSNVTMGIRQPEEEDTSQSNSSNSIYVIIFVVLVCVYLYFKRRTFNRWKMMVLLLVSWVILFWFFMCSDCEDAENQMKSECPITDPVEKIFLNKPSTLIATSLPGSGAELLQMVFENSSDFLYFSSKDVTIPGKSDTSKYDPCYWPEDSLYPPTTAGWFKALQTEPILFLNNLPVKTSRIANIQRKFRESKKTSMFSINLLSGFWNSKLSWLQHIFGHTLSTVIVVRDPRDWIYSLVRDDLPEKLKRRQVSTRKMLTSEYHCSLPSVLPREFRKPRGGSDVEKLSKIWLASVASMVRYGRSVQIVRYEDLIANPEMASMEIYRRLGLPISVPQINRITRAVRTGHYRVGFEGPINRDSTELWRKDMGLRDVYHIERICKDMMNLLGYS